MKKTEFAVILTLHEFVHAFLRDLSQVVLQRDSSFAQLSLAHKPEAGGNCPDTEKNQAGFIIGQNPKYKNTGEKYRTADPCEPSPEGAELE